MMLTMYSVLYFMEVVLIVHDVFQHFCSWLLVCFQTIEIKCKFYTLINKIFILQKWYIQILSNIFLFEMWIFNDTIAK